MNLHVERLNLFPMILENLSSIITCTAEHVYQSKICWNGKKSNIGHYFMSSKIFQQKFIKE